MQKQESIPVGRNSSHLPGGESAGGCQLGVSAQGVCEQNDWQIGVKTLR